MQLLAFLKKYPEYFLFCFTVLARYLIVFFLLQPEKYNKFITYQNDIRGVGFALDRTSFNPEQWSYYYIPLGFFYKFLQTVGLFSDRIIALAFLNCILGALSIVLFYKIARFFLSFKSAFLISITGALFYPLIYFQALNISENSFIFLLLAALLLFLKTELTKPFAAVSFGILLGLAYLIKPLLLLFIPLVILWIILTQRTKLRMRIQTIVLFVLPICMLLLSAGLINQHVSQHKQLIFSGSGAVNFAMTQCHIKQLGYKLPSGEHAWLSPPLYWNSSYPTITTNEPFQNTLYYTRMGLACFMNNPTRSLANFIDLKNVFFGPFYPDFPTDIWHKKAIDISLAVNFVFFLLFLLYPFVETDPYKKRQAMLIYFLIASVLFTLFLGNPGESRYGVTFFLFFLLFGTRALIHALKR